MIVPPVQGKVIVSLIGGIIDHFGGDICVLLLVAGVIYRSPQNHVVVLCIGYDGPQLAVFFGKHLVGSLQVNVFGDIAQGVVALCCNNVGGVNKTGPLIFIVPDNKINAKD